MSGLSNNIPEIQQTDTYKCDGSPCRTSVYTTATTVGHHCHPQLNWTNVK